MGTSTRIAGLCFLWVAGCSVPGDLGSLAGAFAVPDGGYDTVPAAGCPGQDFDPLWAYELGASSPVEAAWFIPAGEINAAALGPGITNIQHDMGGGNWLWISFEAPVVAGALPTAFGPPSCATNTAVLFDPLPRDGGFFQRSVQAQVQVVTTGTDAGDRIELDLTQVRYDDDDLPISLPDIHLDETLQPWVPPAGEPDGGS